MLICWRFMFSMLAYVQSAGFTPCLIAAFSAGMPKASKPIGCSTLQPCIFLNRAMTSPIE